MEEKERKKGGLRKELRQRMAAYITAAFGLVAGLAWNDAVRSLIELLFPIKKDSVLAKFIYAILMTIILVTITTYILSVVRRSEIEK